MQELEAVIKGKEAEENQKVLEMQKKMKDKEKDTDKRMLELR